MPLYEHLVRTGAWWDLVDPVASNRIGPIPLAHREALTPLVRAWATDDDLWVRRTAILSQLAFRADTDTALLRACVEPNLADRSFWIRKAIVGPAAVRPHRPGVGPRHGVHLRRPPLGTFPPGGTQAPLRKCAP